MRGRFRGFGRRLNQFAAQEFSTSAGAFASAGVAGAPLFMALAEVLGLRVGLVHAEAPMSQASAFAVGANFNVLGLDTMAWALVMVGEFDARVFHTVDA